MRQRGFRFVVATHLFQNIGEQQILARFLRLPGDGPRLDPPGIFELASSNADHGQKIQRFGVVNIQPTRLSKCFCGSREILHFQKQAAEGDGCTRMPPMFANKILHDGQRAGRALVFVQNFGLETDQFPIAGIITKRLVENSEGRRIVLFFVT